MSAHEVQFTGGFYEALFQQNPLSIQVLAPDGRTIAVNAAWEALWGVTLADIASYNMLEDQQLVAKGVMPYIRRGFAGEAVAIPPILYDPNETLPDKSSHEDPRRWVRAFIYPVRDSQQIIQEVVLIHEDVTVQQHAQQRLEIQYSVSTALASATSRDDAIRLVLKAVVKGLDWQYGAFWVPRDDGRLVCAAVWHEGTAALEVFEQTSRALCFDAGIGLPGTVWRTGHAIWCADLDELVSFPRRQNAKAAGLRTGSAFPILGAGGPPFGVMEFFTSSCQAGHAELERMIAATAHQLGQSLARWTAAELAGTHEVQRAAIVAASLDAIVSADEHGCVSEFNPAAEQIFGYTRAAVLGRQLAELIIPPRLRERHYEGMARYLATGEARVLGQRVEMDAMRADGSEFPCELTITRIPLPGPARFAGVVRDITERRRAEENLRASVEQTLAAEREQHASAARLARLQALAADLSGASTSDQIAAVVVRHAREGFEAAAASIALFDPTRTHLTIASSAGYSPELIAEYRSMSADSNVPLAEAARTGRALWFDNREELLAHCPELAHATEPHANGAWAAVPLVFGGESLGAIGLSFREHHPFLPEERELLLAFGRLGGQALDRARLYEAERRARANAESASRAKDEFLAVVSHELRTPLNAVLGWARMLQSGDVSPSMWARAIDAIHRNARSQTQLIEDLLDISRIITGKLRLDVKAVDLAPVVHHALESVQLAARAKDIVVEHTLAPVPALWGDPERIQQVIWNLLSNAIKFTPAGGRVSVTLERCDGGVLLTVRDTGCGIPPDVLPYVFDRFRQADSSTTRLHGGLGLGLAIVRHLVELHGGTVSVSSEGPGRGAVFTVRFPQIAVTADQPGPHSAQTPSLASGFDEAASLENVTVLCVDDEPDARDLLQAMLAVAGARVRMVSSMAEALVSLDTASADILVSDVEMPGADGYDLIRAVRRHRNAQVSGVPAIALTAHARSEDRVRVLAAGYDMHLPKPVDRVELVNVIRALLERRRAAPSENS